MKSKKDNKKSKLNNLKSSAKAALPIFALFGGQGFASSRNPFSLQSSKKIAGKSVVYINDMDAPALPELGVKSNQVTKSAFAAFTNKAVIKTKNAEINVQSKAMEFLHSNNLLSSNKTIRSELSGNTLEQSRKSFSHTWQWNLVNSKPFSADSTMTSPCVSGATYNGYDLVSMKANYTLGYGSYNLLSVTPSGTYYVGFNTSAPAILNEGQLLHQACAGHVNLPVELMKFEVD